MKYLRIIVIFSAFFFHPLSVFSYHWFPSGAFCHTNGAAARCDVTNFNHYPMYCEGTVTAVTAYGYYLYGGMYSWIPPGGTGFSSVVRAPWPLRDPIVSVWHEIWCRF